MSEVGVIEPLPAGTAKPERYALLRRQVAALLEGEGDWLPNLANVAAAVYASLPGLNWAGFYLLRGGELVLGPFQGQPACVRIEIGRGVCGTAAAERRTLVVDDVDEFPGHIACDPRSRSEIVVPVVIDGRTVAVLDLDSSERANFDAEDRAGLEGIVSELSAAVDWSAATFEGSAAGRANAETSSD